MNDGNLPRELVELAARVVAANLAAGRTVAVAESCTGGLVGSALTEIAGSSRVFDRGFVTYSNEAKTEMLGVAPDLIDTFGAVSVAVAWAMADGAIRRSQADVAVAITGVAGPDGGSPNKPVGTVVFAVARRDDPDETANAEMKHLDPAQGRGGIRLQAALVALELLLP
ncbi:CinA family protein [Novosphingobium sp. Gsoil 351]|uniref:CinA family protein n=1 Tax=Novosphingobium sp. Gsoil 351 TaxID=2675225 RepID=UPI0012B4EA2A|nr:CinA family protein [Novosphingobium sp. Gsoil 351]QGN53356.1 nicotinamide-nucleotide amidohydrolase family protein [Novosphingobium sp. Gsoil 351]